jgi:hypothetical protein
MTNCLVEIEYEIRKYDEKYEDEQDLPKHKLQSFSLKNQKLIRDRTKALAKEYIDFCRKEDEYYLNRIKKSDDDSKKRIEKEFEKYCNHFGHARTRVKNANITCIDTKIYIMFENCDYNKLSKRMYTEYYDGFFSTSEDITLSGEDYLLLPQLSCKKHD